MENNQYVIRNNNGSANIETLSIKGGCIDAGSLSFSDGFHTIKGKLLNTLLNTIAIHSVTYTTTGCLRMMSKRNQTEDLISY